MRFIFPWGNFLSVFGGTINGTLNINGPLNVTGLVTLTNNITSTHPIQTSSSVICDNAICNYVDSLNGGEFDGPIIIRHDNISGGGYHISLRPLTAASVYSILETRNLAATRVGVVGHNVLGDSACGHGIGRSDSMPVDVALGAGLWNLDGAGKILSGTRQLMLHSMMFS